jgi:hypothetical protein
MRITTLVPAYKIKYIDELVHSLLMQTIFPQRVIFSDDTPNLQFKQYFNSSALKSIVDKLNIEVIEGPKIGGNANFCNVIRYFNRHSELVHVLCDDDIIFPTFYERHLNAHNNGQFSTSISRRWSATDEGRLLNRHLPVPEVIQCHPNRNISIEAKYIFETTIGSARNWLGEFSNAVYRSEFAENIISRKITGISYAGLEDLGSFAEGSLSLPICFINEHLGFWRQNAEQFSSQPFGPALKLAFLSGISLVIIGRNLKLIDTNKAQETIFLIASNIAYHYKNELDMGEFCSLMHELMANVSGSEDKFLEAWDRCKLSH